RAYCCACPYLTRRSRWRRAPQRQERQRGSISISSFLVLLGLDLGRCAGVDAERTGDFRGARANSVRYAGILGNCREQLACLLPAALFEQRQRGHLARRSKPRLTGFGQRLEPGNHFLRLKLIELDSGLTDERGVAVRRRQATIGGNCLVSRGGRLDVTLL